MRDDYFVSVYDRIVLGYLAHLVSRFACNTRVIINESSISWFLVSNCCNEKARIKPPRKQTKTNVASSINQMVIR